MITIEYGAGSSKFSVECDNKLVGYATILMHYADSPGAVVIYAPEELTVDSWVNFSGRTEERIEPLFKDAGGFDAFVQSNVAAIQTCYKTRKRLV